MKGRNRTVTKSPNIVLRAWSGHTKENFYLEKL